MRTGREPGVNMVCTRRERVAPESDSSFSCEHEVAGCEWGADGGARTRVLAQRKQKKVVARVQ